MTGTSASFLVNYWLTQRRASTAGGFPNLGDWRRKGAKLEIYGGLNRRFGKGRSHLITKKGSGLIAEESQY